MTHKATNILNISRLTENHLITRNTQTYSHQHCLMTQLLFLAECDIVYNVSVILLAVKRFVPLL